MAESCDSFEWLAALRAGDASAWRPLYTFLRERVLRAVPLPPGVNPEEVLADTASTVWLSAKSLRDESKFFSFVATIARRIVSQRRRECSRYAPLPEEARLPSKESSTIESLERNETLENLTRALRASDKQLFKLLYVLGSTSDEAQDALQVSPEILRKRKHRLRRRLRDAAGQEDGDDKGE